MLWYKWNIDWISVMSVVNRHVSDTRTFSAISMSCLFFFFACFILFLIIGLVWALISLRWCVCAKTLFRRYSLDTAPPFFCSLSSVAYPWKLCAHRWVFAFPKFFTWPTLKFYFSPVCWVKNQVILSHFDGRVMHWACKGIDEDEISRVISDFFSWDKQHGEFNLET